MKNVAKRLAAQRGTTLAGYARLALVEQIRRDIEWERENPVDQGLEG